jgi:hypothetical protein
MAALAFSKLNHICKTVERIERVIQRGEGE